MHPQSHQIRAEEMAELLIKAKSECRNPKVIQRLNAISSYLIDQETFVNSARKNGLSPSSLQRWLHRFDPTNLESLEDHKQLIRGIRTPETPPEVIELIKQYRLHSPKFGKNRIARLLQSEHGKIISASTVGRVIEQEHFFFGETPLHLRKNAGQHESPSPGNLSSWSQVFTHSLMKPWGLILFLSMGCNILLAVTLLVLFIAIAYSYSLTRVSASPSSIQASMITDDVLGSANIA